MIYLKAIHRHSEDFETYQHHDDHDVSAPVNAIFWYMIYFQFLLAKMRFLWFINMQGIYYDCSN